ncbi:uncharacterized protein LOC143470926 [Clavelina lepadiformis]|uniref:uncharacterized protein LOC143470926 n=1 Tax=Clavelina lepadiformis TaxID=159417 RepID=UPI0040434058
MGGIPERILLLIKHIFLACARCFRKIICIGRRRKTCDDSDPTSVVIVSGSGVYSAQQQPQPLISETNSNTSYIHPSLGNSFQTQEWSSWDNQEFEQSNVPFSEPSQIPQPSPSLDTNTNLEADEPEVDFFKDMEPTVKVKKVFLKKKTAATTASNRLAMDHDLEFKTSGELDVWEDDEGWNADDSDDLEIDETQVLREAQEQRRLERQTRSKQQRQSKNAARQQEKLALKVS